MHTRHLDILSASGVLLCRYLLADGCSVSVVMSRYVLGHGVDTPTDYTHHAMYVGDVRTGVTSTDYTDMFSTALALGTLASY